MFFAWPSPSIPQLISEEGYYHFTLEECSYLIILPEVSMVITGLFCPTVADKIGRKTTILLTFLPIVTSITLTAIARKLYLFYIARIFAGIANGTMFSTLPTYIGEIATPKVRGFWGNAPVCFALFGQLLTNATGGYLDIATTAWIMLLFPIIFIVTFPFASESPYFCIMKSKRNEAEKILQKLRGCEDVETELVSIETAVHRQLSETCTWKELMTNQSNRKGLLAGIFLRSSQLLSGIASVSTYNQYIFQKAATGISPVNCAIIYNVIMLFFTLGSLSFIDKFGRRVVTTISLLGCGLSLVCISSYFYVEQTSPSAIVNLTWIPLAGIIVYVLFYSFGLSTVPTLMLGELFSAKSKAKALAILIFVMGFWISVTTKVFQVLNSNFGMHIPFLLFTICCFCNAVLVRYFVPETKGKTLEEIQMNLKELKR